LRALASGGLVAALEVPIVQFGVHDFVFGDLPAGARFGGSVVAVVGGTSARSGIGGRWAADPAVVRISSVDHLLSGALGTPSEAGGRASGAEPGRLEAAAPGEWLDVAVIFRQYHADLVRLALLLVGDRGSAEDVVQDVFARLCARGRGLEQHSALAYVRTAVVNGCRSVLRRRALARRVAGGGHSCRAGARYAGVR
jgi:hypothetical protein